MAPVRPRSVYLLDWTALWVADISHCWFFIFPAASLCTLLELQEPPPYAWVTQTLHWSLGLICFLPNCSRPLFTLRLLHNSQLRSDHQQVPIYPSLDCLQEVAILLGFHGGSLFRMIYDEFANITDEQKAIMTFNYTTLLFRPDRCLWIVSHRSFSEDN